MKKIDLANPESYKEVVSKLTNNVIKLQVTETLIDVTTCDVWISEHSEFSTLYPERAEVIKTLLIDNEWMGLQFTPHDRVIKLFSNHLVSLFTMEDRYDFDNHAGIIHDILKDKLRYNLLQIAIFDERDDFKHKLVDALRNNQEQITTALFFGEIKTTQPTTANWFTIYTNFMVPGAKFSKFQQSKFFKKNDNILRLNEKELENLRLLFDVYEKLKISSWEPEGLEETFFYDGEQGLGVIEYGEIIPYTKEETAQIKKIMQSVQSKNSSLNVNAKPVARPPVDFVHARPTVHPDIEGVDIDATKGPDHFSEQDAADIEKHIAKSGELTAADIAYHKQAEDLKHHLQIVFQTPEVEKKFTDLLVSVLRGLRDVMELRGYLEELRYTKEQIEPIASAIKEVLSGKTSTANQVSPTPVTDGAVKPSLNQIQQQIQQSAEHTAQHNGGQVDVESGATTTESPKPQSVLRQILLPKLRRSRKQRKPIIDDVKLQQSMVMGPLDELKAMDLIEFRRLSPDPASAAMKLKDKVDLLGEEAVSKQADGIKAFKQSPINSQYLDIGNKSMMTGKPVTDIIQELQAAGIPVLSIEEFNAIADLNKRIRF